jgi:hypothetical protein
MGVRQIEAGRPLAFQGYSIMVCNSLHDFFTKKDRECVGIAIPVQFEVNYLNGNLVASASPSPTFG